MTVKEFILSCNEESGNVYYMCENKDKNGKAICAVAVEEAMK